MPVSKTQHRPREEDTSVSRSAFQGKEKLWLLFLKTLLVFIKPFLQQCASPSATRARRSSRHGWGKPQRVHPRRLSLTELEDWLEPVCTVATMLTKYFPNRLNLFMVRGTTYHTKGQKYHTKYCN
eukprot:2421327-Amphidinium_carterae.1